MCSAREFFLLSFPPTPQTATHPLPQTLEEWLEVGLCLHERGAAKLALVASLLRHWTGIQILCPLMEEKLQETVKVVSYVPRQGLEEVYSPPFPVYGARIWACLGIDMTGKIALQLWYLFSSICVCW